MDAKTTPQGVNIARDFTASPSADEKADIDFSQPATDPPCLPSLLARLWKQYADVLSVEVGAERLDYLLWVGLDFAHTFASQDPDSEHLAIGMLALEGAITDLATANWDGLIEAGMRELGYDEKFYRITVTREDLRGPAAAAVLYKFMAVRCGQSNMRPSIGRCLLPAPRRSLGG